MKTKSKAKTSRKRKSESSSTAKEETLVKQDKDVVEEDTSTEEKETDEKSSESSSRKGGRRRQSSPRGRRAVKFDPEDYVYNRLLIYTDGAARGNPGESGAGVVLKTPEGEEVGRFGRYLGKGTNNFAEYQALILGLQHAQEFGANDITILSDSDLLVRQLVGEYRVRAAHLRVLFDEAQQMLAEFDKYQIKRIEREKNKEADSMANRAIDERL
ncbi:MAG: ribonuclease HI family protein [Deltaproteobacteria bacterium]|nr:MAG: ribonuclease HI family protein [Deltaproteobacteria bacterium]